MDKPYPFSWHKLFPPLSAHNSRFSLLLLTINIVAGLYSTMWMEHIALHSLFSTMLYVNDYVFQNSSAYDGYNNMITGLAQQYKNTIDFLMPWIEIITTWRKDVHMLFMNQSPSNFFLYSVINILFIIPPQSEWMKFFWENNKD